MRRPRHREARVPKGVKVPVSERALHQRINRALAKEGRCGYVLKKVRPDNRVIDAWIGNYGYVLDADRNTIEQRVDNLEKLGRELGVLKPYERLAEEER
jgi:hypothetical protein